MRNGLRLSDGGEVTLLLITGLLATMTAVALFAPDDPGFERIEVDLWVAELDASLILTVRPESMTAYRAHLIRVVDTRRAVAGLVASLAPTTRRLLAA